MNVGYCQMDVARGGRQANLVKARSAAEQLHADLLVLPELFNCGYLFNSRSELIPLAESIPDGPTTEALAGIARSAGCCVIGGIAEWDGQDLYNTAVVVSGRGYVGKYRKMHLSRYERNIFTSGDRVALFDVDGIKLGVQICFDLWFPELSRELILQGADILCVSANFGGPATPLLAKARAIENMAFVLMCNRVGEEHTAGIDATFVGRSAVIAPDGSILAGDKENAEEFQTISIDPLPLRKKSNAICGDLLKEAAIHYPKS